MNSTRSLTKTAGDVVITKTIAVAGLSLQLSVAPSMNC